MPLVGGDRVGVDLGDDQRHVVVHAPVAGVVDDDRAGLDELRRPLGADRAAGGGEREVEAVDRLVRERPALELAAGEAGPACPAERSEANGTTSRAGSRARRAPRGSSSRRRRSRRRRRPGSRQALIDVADRRAVRRRSGPRRWIASAPSSKASCSACTAVGHLVGGDHAGDLDRRGGDHLDVDLAPRRGSGRPSRRRRGGCACRRRRSRPCRSARRSRSPRRRRAPRARRGAVAQLVARRR